MHPCTCFTTFATHFCSVFSFEKNGLWMDRRMDTASYRDVRMNLKRLFHIMPVKYYFTLKIWIAFLYKI